jgi:hypothetical protein
MELGAALRRRGGVGDARGAEKAAERYVVKRDSSPHVRIVAFSDILLIFFAFALFTGVPWLHAPVELTKEQLASVDALAKELTFVSSHKPFRALLPPFTKASTLVKDLCKAFNGSSNGKGHGKSSGMGVGMGHHHGLILDEPPAADTHLLASPFMFEASALPTGAKGRYISRAAVGAQRMLLTLVKALQMGRAAEYPVPRLLTPHAPCPARSPLLFIDVNMPEQVSGVTKLNGHEALLVSHICASLLGLLPGTSAKLI